MVPPASSLPFVAPPFGEEGPPALHVTFVTFATFVHRRR
jgi:hypothetical protein